MRPCSIEDDAVRLLNRRQTVGDDQAGAAGQQRLERGLNQLFVRRIEALVASSKIKMRGVGQDGARDRDALAFAARQAIAAFTHEGRVVFGQAGDELVNLRGARGLLQVFVAGVGAGVAKVVGDAGVEQVRLLRHDGNVLAQRLQLDVAVVVTVEQNATGGGVVQAQSERGQRALTGARGTDHRDRFAGRDVELDVAERACSSP